MTVVHVGPKNYPPNHGGVEAMVYEIACGMPGIETHVFTERQPGTQANNVYQLPSGVLAAFRQLRTHARSHKVGLLHFHKETFVILCLLCALTGFRTVITIHGCAWRQATWAPFYRAMFFMLDCAACLLLPMVIFVSEVDRAVFQRLFPWRTLHCIPNGTRCTAGDRNTSRDGWVYVGRIAPEKNVLALVRAASDAGIPLTLYGPIGDRNSSFNADFRACLSEYPSVSWRGPIEYEAVGPVLRRYSVFVNPSLAEGMPVSVLEAAAAGLYLVLSDIPQHRRLSFPRCTYVDPMRLDLSRIPSRPPSGAPNSAWLASRYSVTAMISAYKTIYTSHNET